MLIAQFIAGEIQERDCLCAFLRITCRCKEQTVRVEMSWHSSEATYQTQEYVVRSDRLFLWLLNIACDLDDELISNHSILSGTIPK